MMEAVARTGRPNCREGDPGFAFALDVVQRAERHGFATTLVAERFLGPDLEAWMLSAALAVQTQSIEIMTAVHPGIMAPQVAAKMGATLDRLTGGRFALNVVNGWWREEFDEFGNGAWLDDANGRYRRMEEFIRATKTLWCGSGEPLDGEFYRLTGARLPMAPCRPPHPPIYAASRSAVGKRVVAEQADVWFVNYGTDLGSFDPSLRAVRQEIDEMRSMAGARGRTLGFAVSAHVICCDTMEKALTEAAALALHGQQDRISMVAAKALGAGLVGTPALVAERIRAYASVGVTCFMLHFHPMIDGLEQFAAEVMPLLQLEPVH